MASPPPAKSSAVKVDSRRHIRAACQVPARLLVAPASEYSCTIVDLSEDGIGVRMTETLRAGTNCMVSFDLIDDNMRRRVNAWGKVVYSNEHVQAVRAGIQFVDMDSYSKLLLHRVPILCGS